MPDLTTAVALAGSTMLTLGDFLSALRRRQFLRPLILEAALEKLLLERARQVALEISPEQLQQAVNRFRQQHGLRERTQTQRWLDEQGLSLPELETTLETDLLIARLAESVTATSAAEHFAAHRDDFAQAQLRLLMAASEGEARELCSQLTDEGRDFAELARQHSIHLASRAAGGSLTPMFRCEFPAPVAQALFSARPGAVVGPVRGAMGFSLFLVEELLPPEENSVTMTLIRRRLFDAWVRQRLAEVRVDLSWLDQTDVSS